MRVTTAADTATISPPLGTHVGQQSPDKVVKCSVVVHKGMAHGVLGHTSHVGQHELTCGTS